MIDWRSNLNNFSDRVVSKLKHYFPERQILLKEENKIRCLHVTTLHQVFLLSLLCFGIFWTIGVTFGFLQQTVESDIKENVIASKEAQVEDLKKNYQSAFVRLDEIESLFSGITCEISDIQDSLLIMSEHVNANEKHASMPRLNHNQSHCTDHQNAQNPLYIANDIVSKEPLSPTNSPIALNSDSASKGGDPDAEQLRLRAAQLSNELSKLKASHNAFLQNSVTITEKRIDQLQKTLSSVGLSKVIYGQGGPYIPLASKNNWSIKNGFDPIALFNNHADRYDRLNKTLQELPLASPLVDYDLTSSFGARNDPINAMTGVHEGIDMGAPIGTKVSSTGEGLVIWAGWKERYGNLIEIEHSSGVQTRYAHLAKVNVKVGDHVHRGQLIGTVGDTGRTTGPHLHYEVRIDEMAVNPMRFITVGENVLKTE